MKEHSVLEVCVDSAESALAAVRGGADRLELCANLVIGGTTPSPALYREIRRTSDIRMHALIRPRFGDFCYTDSEFRTILDEISMYRSLGAEGVVIGVLRPDGNLDLERMKLLMEETEGMSVTLHRAFDVCRDPFRALSEAKDLGIQTILTSGQANTCLEGRELLGKLVREARDEIQILVGSGVNAEAIRILQPETGARAFHMSGKTTLESSMTYRKQGVSMGLPSLSEYEIWRTSEESVREARRELDARIERG